MANVSLRHISKRFGHVDAVRDLSLVVNDGGFVVLLGPSGAGKTTALRLVTASNALMPARSLSMGAT
jgi:multiple sugar transport system ATP-binding protein